MLVLGELKEANLEIVDTLPDNPQLGRAVVYNGNIWVFIKHQNDNIERWTVVGDPIGTIKPIFDYNDNVLQTIDHNIWVLCDGSVINTPALTAGDNTGLLNGQNTPDLSAGYLVGAGTPGGGDIGSDNVSTSPTGNTGNTVNLQHSHTVNNHTHTLPNHSHGQSATLGIPGGGGRFQINGSGYHMSLSTQSGYEGNHQHFLNSTGGVNSYPQTGGSTPGTNNQLSSTQNIQPRSIKVRYYIKVR